MLAAVAATKEADCIKRRRSIALFLFRFWPLKNSAAMSPRVKSVLILPALLHVIRRDLARFPSKAMDQIIRHRSYLGIREPLAKGRHESSGVNSPKVRSRKQRLHEIGALGITHSATTL